MLTKPLTTIELTLKLQGQTKLTQSAGSLLHGVIMELIDPAYAAQMHTEALRPYSQYVYFDKKDQALKWRISSLSIEAAEKILTPMWNLPDSFRLKQKNLTVEIAARDVVTETDYDTVTSTYLGGSDTYRKLHFHFLTSTSFKCGGTYVIYPDAGLIYQSLLQHWNLFSDSEVIDAPDAVQELVKNLFVGTYELRLHPFALEKTHIQAFRGKYTLILKSNIVMRRIAAMLAYSAQFAGVGAKTALGMGGTQVGMEEWK